MPKSRYAYELPEHKVEYGVSVAVADLKIDPQAQRTLNERRAQGIANNLVREAMGSIVVSQRADGSLYVVDGMHRKRVCELTNTPRITAEVHHGLSQKEEAVLFLIKNRESNKPNPLDEYKVGLTGGIDLFVDTEATLKKHGLEMGSTSTNSVGAVAGVLRITENYGPDILDRTLGVAEAAWGRNGSTWDGMLLGGIGMFLGRHGEIVKDSELAAKIQKTGPAQKWVASVHSLASGGGLHNTGTGSRVQTCYSQLVTVWNKGKKKNLIPA
ncbi:DUF6551 family protein [Actinomycetospora sp. TBRC 11914]|uniref:DUF6551 family protein n=1 Tax=Actinomycetospora sp. TBRC 11914 TaxID=2729387 RepID=UPI00145E539D|nr:DUF6551 family protein [Actinomycetospora sp. TBRC 11914]NMO93995.1 hypothetical protein [Actinomycetospora sp. TBRC 11914]